MPATFRPSLSNMSFGHLNRNAAYGANAAHNAPPNATVKPIGRAGAKNAADIAMLLAGNANHCLP